MAAAADLLGEQHARIAAPDVERADTFRAIRLVSRQRHQIHLRGLYVERHFTETLRRIEGAKVESLGRLVVKGRSEAVEAYRLLALAAPS